VTTKRAVVLFACIFIAGILFFLAIACGTKAAPFDPCQVNPTRTIAPNEWVEADGEPLDSDPCDSDDFDSKGHPKPKKPAVTPTKTGVVTVPAKPAVVPTKNTTGTGSRKSYK
jgi:hypothetical protein